MEMNDIRKKNDKELRDELAALRKEQFNLRMQAAAGQAPARPSDPQRRARTWRVSRPRRTNA